MAVGIITGSGTHALPGFDGGEPEPVATPWGVALVSSGRLAGVDVLHVSRHGAGHVRLSNHVTHRANIAALARAGAAGVVAVTVCGAVDPAVPLGSLICFDDLHFLSNRLPDGSLCTFFAEAGDPRRGHWIYEDPYSPELRRQHYARLNAPDGSLYLAGEHLSYINGWIAGSLGSARLVVAAIHERASREASVTTTTARP